MPPICEVLEKKHNYDVVLLTKDATKARITELLTQELLPDPARQQPASWIRMRACCSTLPVMVSLSTAFLDRKAVCSPWMPNRTPPRRTWP